MAFQEDLNKIFGELQTPSPSGKGVPKTFQGEIDSIFTTPEPTPKPTIVLPPPKKSIISKVAETTKKGAIKVSDFLFRDKASEARKDFEAENRRAQEQAEFEILRQQRKEKKKFVILPESIKKAAQKPLTIPSAFPKVAERSPDFGEVDVKEPLRRNVGSFTSGAFSSVEGVVGALEWAGVDRAKPAADKLKEWSEALAPEDPDFAQKVISGFGSAAVFYIPGLGFMKGSQILFATSPRIAALFGNSVATGLEAATEAGIVYRDNLAQGKSKTQASLKATATFASNAALIFLTNKFGIFDVNTQSSLKKTLETALLEGGQEAAQQIVSNIATDRPMLEGVRESGIIGAIVGGAIGSFVNLPANVVQQKLSESPSTPSDIQVEEKRPEPLVLGEETTEEDKPKEEFSNELENIFKEETVTLFRGESVAQGKEGRFFSTNREFARNFTQSGQDNEIAEIKIEIKKIYRPKELPFAGNEEQINATIKEAKDKGFNAFYVDEGQNQPNSVFFIEKPQVDQLETIELPEEELGQVIRTDKIVKLPRVKPKKVLTPEQESVIDKNEQQTAQIEETLELAQLKRLEEFKVSRGDGGFTLPEAGTPVPKRFLNMTREELYRKNKPMFFRRFGDELTSEFGFNDNEELKEAFERYMDMKKEARDLRKQNKDIAESAEEEFDQEQLDKINAAIQSVSNSVEVFVKGQATPVKTAGEEKKSKAFGRVKERLGDILEDDPTYNRLNLADDTAKAIRFVEEQPERARRIAFGLEQPPAELTETAVSIAYAEKMLEEGKAGEAGDAERSRSFRQTRRGQEIVAERGRVNENSPSHFIQMVIKARLEQAGKKVYTLIRNVRQSVEESSITKAREKIKEDSTRLKKNVANRQIDIAEAQKILDSLICP